MENTKKFNELYAKYNKLVFAIAYRNTHNPDIAEDVTQDTFLAIYQKMDLFDGIDEKHERNLVGLFTKYQSRIAYKKTMKFYKTFDTITEDTFEIEEEDHYKSIDTAIDMENLLQSLSEDEAKMIKLRFYDGYSNDEVASIFGMKKSWCSQKTSNILKKMRNKTDKP